MGKPTGFLEYSRSTHTYLSVDKRKKNFNEFIIPLKDEKIMEQGARCMDCGIPFCQSGCPLGNIIPDFNHFVYQKDYHSAFKALLSTNNFPDITGRVCPAPCESACVLGINAPPVSIKGIEYALGEKGFVHNWFSNIKVKKKNKRVAIIGSGPAGLACADQLSSLGYQVSVFEREDELGGLLMYGIPNFKLEKKIVFRHIIRMKKKGVKFFTKVEVGKDLSVNELKSKYSVLVLAIGSTVSRDLNIPHRHASGVHLAMDFLTQSTKLVMGKKIFSPLISARDKRVLVIGGGDTGSDCIGTSVRQGAKQIIQIEILSKPPLQRDASMPWPQYDRIFRVSTSQKEGCIRKFSILTNDFIVDSNNRVRGINYVQIRWDTNKKKFIETGKNGKIQADLVLLALGFVSPEKKLFDQLKIKVDQRDNVEIAKNKFQTNIKNIFVAGDSRRGQSLVVWAISEGRECAIAVDEFLSKEKSTLESKQA